VILQEREPGIVEVAAVDPTVAMERVGKPALTELAEHVRTKLSAVMERL